MPRLELSCRSTSCLIVAGRRRWPVDEVESRPGASRTAARALTGHWRCQSPCCAPIGRRRELPSPRVTPPSAGAGAWRSTPGTPRPTRRAPSPASSRRMITPGRAPHHVPLAAHLRQPPQAERRNPGTCLIQPFGASDSHLRSATPLGPPTSTASRPCDSSRDTAPGGGAAPSSPPGPNDTYPSMRRVPGPPSPARCCTRHPRAPSPVAHRLRHLVEQPRQPALVAPFAVTSVATTNWCSPSTATRRKPTGVSNLGGTSPPPLVLTLHHHLRVEALLELLAARLPDLAVKLLCALLLRLAIPPLVRPSTFGFRSWSGCRPRNRSTDSQMGVQPCNSARDNRLYACQLHLILSCCALSFAAFR